MKDVRRIGTFNLGNLARAGAEVYDTEPRSEEEYAAKRGFLQDILTRLDADVLGVQEIFHIAALLEATEGCYDPDQVHAPLPDGVFEDEARSPRVGLLCRRPLVGAPRVHRRFPHPHGVLGLELTEFRRPILEARVELWPDLEVSVFVAHLKSPRPLFLEGEDEHFPGTTARAEARAHAVRMTEVAELKVLVAEAGARGPVILLGDLNAKAEEPTLGALRGRRAPEGADDDAKARFEAARLFDARSAARRNGGAAFGDTYVYGGRPQTIDHVLVSTHLTPWTEFPRARVSKVRTFDTHLGDDPHALVRTASDHAPVLVTLELA